MQKITWLREMQHVAGTVVKPQLQKCGLSEHICVWAAPQNFTTQFDGSGT